MKRYSLLAFAALAAGACAPAAPATAPAPQPTARDGAAPRVQLRALTSAPDDWWLLDPAADGVLGIGAERAHRELLAGREPARSVVVAIIDSGVDIRHQDLRNNLWINDGETAGTGRDDDGNGYVDDVHGWNFIGGPDGRNVDRDTYEVARLYARLRPVFGNARSDTLSGAARAGFEQYRRIRTELEHEQAETRRQMQQLGEIEQAVTRVFTLLRTVAGTDSLTLERVNAIQTTRPDVRQAQAIYREIVANDLTPEALLRHREHLQGRLEFGLNPDFDPRPIVGDNPADLTERFYGNSDVIGPDASHGTHVAGIVAANRTDDSGVRGVAPTARIMTIRTVPNGDERDKDVANAIRYAVDNGAHVINMSFGKGHSPEKEVVDAAVRYAASRGVLMVHAAGNEGKDLAVSENYPTRVLLDGDTAQLWIEVGASSWWGVDSIAATFSNFGRNDVDVFAPGVDIRSTVPDGRYERNSGTSMAAPVVSGVAALLMAYFPELSAAQVREIILESATPFRGQRTRRPGERPTRVDFCDLARTCGVVNAYEAVRMAQRMTASAGVRAEPVGAAN